MTLSIIEIQRRRSLMQPKEKERVKIKLTREQAVKQLQVMERMAATYKYSPELANQYLNAAMELKEFIRAIDQTEYSANAIDVSFEEIPSRERTESGRKTITKPEKG